MNTAVAIKKPISPARFGTLLAIFMAILSATILPIFVVSSQYWMGLILCHGFAMGVFAYYTAPEVSLPSEGLPPGVREELLSGRRHARMQDVVIPTAFMPMMLFALAWPDSDPPVSWRLWLALGIYLVVGISVLVHRARQ